MAKMGLSVRDDPPKVVDLSIREFGHPQNGLVLSVLQLVRDDPAALTSVSIVLRNLSQESRAFGVPGWLAFYRFEVRQSDGAPAPLTPFGRALTSPERKNERLTASLAPGAFHETEVPLGSIFRLRIGEAYRVRAICEPLPGQEVQSNEILLR